MLCLLLLQSETLRSFVPPFKDGMKPPYSLFSSRFTLSDRTVQTQSLKPDDATVILNTQRLKRPSSPHFTIYQPQLTWLGSIANRVTGVGLSVCPSTFLSLLSATNSHQCSTASPSRILSHLPLSAA